MKICRVCSEFEESKPFMKRENICKECQSIRNKQYYQDNYTTFYASVATRRNIIHNWFRNYCIEMEFACEQCGESRYPCLDFHHVDPIIKDIDIRVAIHNGWSIERILAEIAKCIVLCGNCHMVLHANGTPKLVGSKRFIREYKQSHSCVSCGESRWSCLGFHHRNPDEKFMGICDMVCKGYSIELVKLEIMKCDIICTNCHRTIPGHYDSTEHTNRLIE